VHKHRSSAETCGRECYAARYAGPDGVKQIKGTQIVLLQEEGQGARAAWPRRYVSDGRPQQFPHSRLRLLIQQYYFEFVPTG
jgi:hypothetical protein